ncbi:uncharacterized protein LOC130963067 [Arachis stenosperma]|uniref:uncharacterized protein LOC130963067 n=1 Tax=Arachis stenosperma TaxID=217475 RepID=UPI0025AC1C62|nr:uncharacterized protein LOC130963067 [Arachis stenosperma]
MARQSELKIEKYVELKLSRESCLPYTHIPSLPVTHTSLPHSSKVPWFHLRAPYLREGEAEGDRELANRRSKPRGRSSSPSKGRRRRVAEQHSQSRALEQHSNVQPVQPPSKTPVAEPPNNQSLSCKNPKRNRTMSSSEKLHQLEKMRMSLVWILIKHGGCLAFICFKVNVSV